MSASDPLPTFRALKYGPTGPGAGEADCQPREDVSIHFFTRASSVTSTRPGGHDRPSEPFDYEVGPMAVARLRGAAVTPDGFVFTERGELLRESVDRVSYLDDFYRRHPQLAAELEATPVEPAPRTVAILTCQRNPNYFHWWTDVLPRCWAMGNSPYRDCTPTTAPLPQEFQRESLRLLGQSTLPLTRPLQRFHEVVFVRGLTYGSSQALAPQLTEFAQWCRRTLDLSPRQAGRKLFVSRKRARDRRLLNEDQVLAALGADFELVEAESLGVAEQASLFSAADVVVAPHGAGLTNLLFCSSPAVVVELVHETDTPVVFRRMAELLGHRYLAIGCTPAGGTSRKASRRDMRVSPATVAAAVASLQAARTS